jgi:predicted GIY-YIG superfamily endonuclease
MQEQKYFCYIYKKPDSGKILYVGYATDASRAFTDGHNELIREFVASGAQYEIHISGPYRDEDEARNVEAALVSVLKPEFNQIEQSGSRFLPLGVPPELASRRADRVLDPHELGRITGGCIIVYCNLTSQLKSGKRKVSPVLFSDEIILDNISGHWAVKEYIDQWHANPSSSPKCLVAVQGGRQDRIVIGSAFIDQSRWAEAEVPEWAPNLRGIPLLDAFKLRGRVVDIKFGAGTSNCTMVVDHSGLALKGYRIKGKS